MGTLKKRIMTKQKKQETEERSNRIEGSTESIVATDQAKFNLANGQSILDHFTIIDDPITIDLMETHCEVLKRCGSGSHVNQEKWFTEYGRLWQLHYNLLMKNVCDYRVMTNAWSMLTIADCFGVKRIRETADKIWEAVKSDIYGSTELVMCLNWKYFHMTAIGDYEKECLYSKLFLKYKWHVERQFHKDKDAMEYYYQTID